MPLQKVELPNVNILQWILPIVYNRHQPLQIAHNSYAKFIAKYTHYAIIYILRDIFTIPNE